MTMPNEVYDQLCQIMGSDQVHTDELQKQGHPHLLGGCAIPRRSANAAVTYPAVACADFDGFAARDHAIVLGDWCFDLRPECFVAHGVDAADGILEQLDLWEAVFELAQHG